MNYRSSACTLPFKVLYHELEVPLTFKIAVGLQGALDGFTGKDVDTIAFLKLKLLDGFSG